MLGNKLLCVKEEMEEFVTHVSVVSQGNFSDSGDYVLLLLWQQHWYICCAQIKVLKMFLQEVPYSNREKSSLAREETND